MIFMQIKLTLLLIFQQLVIQVVMIILLNKMQLYQAIKHVFETITTENLKAITDNLKAIYVTQHLIANM